MTFLFFSIVGMCPHTIWTPGSDLLREDRGCCISSNFHSQRVRRGHKLPGCGAYGIKWCQREERSPN